DDAAVTARVETDRAHVVLGQVAALPAGADALLDVLDRVRESDRLLPRRREKVEREALCRAGADTGKPRELGDEIVDRGAQHVRERSCPPRTGEPGGSRHCTGGMTDVLLARPLSRRASTPGARCSSAPGGFARFGRVWPEERRHDPQSARPA